MWQLLDINEVFANAVEPYYKTMSHIAWYPNRSCFLLMITIEGTTRKKPLLTIESDMVCLSREDASCNTLADVLITKQLCRLVKRVFRVEEKMELHLIHHFF